MVMQLVSKIILVWNVFIDWIKMMSPSIIITIILALIVAYFVSLDNKKMSYKRIVRRRLNNVR